MTEDIIELDEDFNGWHTNLNNGKKKKKSCKTSSTLHSKNTHTDAQTAPVHIFTAEMDDSSLPLRNFPRITLACTWESSKEVTEESSSFSASLPQDQPSLSLLTFLCSATFSLQSNRIDFAQTKTTPVQNIFKVTANTDAEPLRQNKS